MRVLYVAVSPASLSESYIQGEREWMESHGVETAFWSPDGGYAPAGASHQLPAELKVYDGELSTAVRHFDPDVVHVHWMNLAERFGDHLRGLEVPFTVRGHSFDFQTARAKALETNPYMRGLWLFPHHAAQVPGQRTRVLPAAYDPRIWNGEGRAVKSNLVFRAGPALVRKGLEEFVEAARRCPGLEFVLGVVDYGIFSLGDGLPPNLKIYKNLQRADVVALMKQARVYLRGHDDSFQYGMPIGIAEAMGVGVPVMYREHPVASTYVGGAGIVYRDLSDLVQKLGQIETLKMPDTAVSSARASNFTVDRLLPRLLDHWKSLS